MSVLYVLATPIGNLEDLTDRARRVLSECDLIAAEDTRVAQKLLNRLGIRKPCVSCHRHNEKEKAGLIVSRMAEEDISVVLVSDAGTPAVSDPGHLLVAAAWDSGIRVIPVCGPSAVVTAVSVSGFDAREFAFFGFLPRERKDLSEKLDRILRTGIPVAVVYESPHRVLPLCEAIAEKWPASRVAVCCDLTKYYEKIVRGSAPEVTDSLRRAENLEKGEYCVVIDLSCVPVPEDDAPVITAETFILSEMVAGSSRQEAAARAAERGYARNEVYRASLRIRERFGKDE